MATDHSFVFGNVVLLKFSMKMPKRMEYCRLNIREEAVMRIQNSSILLASPHVSLKEQSKSESRKPRR